MLRRRGAAALLLSALALGAIGVPSVAAASVIVVDDDGRGTAADCGANAPARQRIQGAVNASSAGGTIVVCPGTYTEQVRIGAAKDGLVLRSKRSFAATIRAPLPLDSGYPALVRIAPGANDVTVIGFRFEARAAEVASAGASGGSECVVHEMIAVHGRRAVIRGNRFIPDGPATLGPCGYRIGVGVGFFLATSGGPDLPPASAYIGYNAFTDFQMAAVLAAGPDVSVVAEQNSVRFLHENYPSDAGSGPASAPGFADGSSPQGGGPGIQHAGIAVGFGATSVLTGNEIWSGHDAAPDFGIGASGVEEEESTPMLDVGIYLFAVGDTVQPNGATTERAARVRGNGILRSQVGILVDDSANVLLGDNLITFGVWGITLDGVVGSRLDSNLADANYFGYSLTEDSEGNRIVDNQARGNLILDCEDRSSGTGTAGTANTWIDNRGNTSDPDGICEPEFAR